MGMALRVSDTVSSAPVVGIDAFIVLVEYVSAARGSQGMREAGKATDLVSAKRRAEELTRVRDGEMARGIVFCPRRGKVLHRGGKETKKR